LLQWQHFEPKKIMLAVPVQGCALLPLLLPTI